jgi:hypothetical protein
LHLDRSFQLVRNGGNQMQLPVSIFPSAIMQKEEECADLFLLRSFPSVVRLYSFDPFPQILGKWVCMESGLLEYRDRSSDRKFQTIYSGDVLGSPAQVNSTIHSSIQSRPKLVKKLSKFKREFVPDGVLEGGINSACPLILHLWQERIGVTFQQSSPSRYEGCAMGVCSVDPSPALLKWGHEL